MWSRGRVYHFLLAFQIRFQLFFPIYPSVVNKIFVSSRKQLERESFDVFFNFLTCGVGGGYITFYWHFKFDFNFFSQFIHPLSTKFLCQVENNWKERVSMCSLTF